MTKVLGCAVLAPLLAYVGLNVVVVNSFTLIHSSRVEFVVQEGDAPLEGVGIRRESSYGKTVSPSVSGALQARVVQPDPLGGRARASTDGKGSATVEAMVQDQGSWLIPRLGISRNLSGSTFRLVCPDGREFEVTLPPYQGQSGRFRIQLGPHPRPQPSPAGD